MTSSKSKSADAAVKVSAYPIPVQILRAEGTPPCVGQIMKLTSVGFLMRVDDSQIYKVGDFCQLSFSLPVMGTPIRSEGRVIKTYDGIGGVIKTEVKAELKKMRTIEIHFKSLSDENRRDINLFLNKTGQKPT